VAVTDRFGCVPAKFAGRVKHGMDKPLPVALLLLILAALVCDTVIHSRPVHAQSATSVHIDGVRYRDLNRDLKHGTDLSIKGTQVIGFSCLGNECFVLSK